ncbi:MAG: metallophosphoesterase family protein [Evtepia sp.]
MLTFLHAADLHLDAPFHALPPDRAAERRREQRQLLTRLAQVAQQAQVDLVFLCGDLFDSQRVRPETLQALHQVLEEMEAPVFLAPGNHDPYTDASPYGKFPWPSHVHLFTTPTPERVALPQLGAVVYGSAFTAPHRMEGPSPASTPRRRGRRPSAASTGTSPPPQQYGPITSGRSPPRG